MYIFKKRVATWRLPRYDESRQFPLQEGCLPLPALRYNDSRQFPLQDGCLPLSALRYDESRQFPLQEGCLPLPSLRYDESKEPRLLVNSNRSSWVSTDVNTPLLDHDAGDAALWSSSTADRPGTLSHQTRCKHHMMEANSNVEESIALQPSCSCSNKANGSSCQCNDSSYNSHLNRKMDAWLSRCFEKDGMCLSTGLCNAPTFPNDTHVIGHLQDNIKTSSPRSVSQTRPIYSGDVDFQTECQTLDENQDSSEVIDEGRDKSFVLNLHDNGEHGGKCKRNVETSSDDQICVDWKSESWDFGVINCPIVDVNRQNRNGDFPERNWNHQTVDGSHNIEDRIYLTGDRNFLNGNGKHKTRDGRNKTGYEKHKHRYRSPQIGDGNCQTGDENPQTGEGSPETEDKSPKSRYRSHQFGDGNQQIKDGSYETEDKNHTNIYRSPQNGDGDRQIRDESLQARNDISPTRDRSPQTEDAEHSPGDDNCSTGKDTQNRGGNRLLSDGKLQTELNCQAEEGNHITGNSDDQTEEINLNNHKIPCLSMKKKLNQDLLRLTEENFCLSAQNSQLRENIRCVRKSTVDECSKILDSIISYCECKANCKPDPYHRRAASCLDTDRIGAGCSTGGCGGYTPSGWNRLMTLHSLECDDPCCPCCCPSCSCAGNCDGDGCSSCCTCCVKQKPRRKRKTCNFTCETKLANENASATQTRPSAKILGELAFQLERRILDYVFGLEGSKRRRFYGYTVNNIQQMIVKEAKNYKGEDDPVRKAELEATFCKLMHGLKQAGYNVKIHGDFAQQMINRYGLLSCPPDFGTVEEFGLQNASCISKLIPQLARGEHEASKFQVLLRSLQYLSKMDNGPLFVW